jgi:hypothetical protein
MKKSIFLLLILIYLNAIFNLEQANTQTPEFKCGTNEYLNQQKKSDPTLESKMILQEQKIQQWIKENFDYKSKEVLIIPVVVHIVYFNDSQNITDSIVFEQIEITNKDYAGLNNNSMNAFHDSLKANTGIQFCLAQRKPDGTLTNGIERRFTTDSIFLNNDVKYYKSGGLDSWDPNNYFNIWVCNTKGLLCWGQFPSTGMKETFGAVVDYQGFGPNALPSWNKGSLTTHEIGHCLFLYHIWGDDDGACSGTDYCNDTPNQANFAFGDPKGVVTDSCTNLSPGIMYMNFMDYTTSYTATNFTPGQTARMRAMFESPYGYLVSLANSDACSPPSTVKMANNLNEFDFNIFPNPVKENTIIKYRLKESKVVSFTISNSLGVKLSQININQMHEPGYYSINFNVGNLTPGVYFMTMQSGNNIGTNKLVIIR